MKLLIMLPIPVVCCSIPFSYIQAEARELKTGKALGFREEPTNSACAGLEGTEGDNGYDQGYVDAHVHFSKQKGFDSDPGNRHSAEYNKQYVNGYNDGWVDARNGIQDPKC